MARLKPSLDTPFEVRIKPADLATAADWLEGLGHGLYGLTRGRLITMFLKVICENLRQVNRVPVYPDARAVEDRLESYLNDSVRTKFLPDYNNEDIEPVPTLPEIMTIGEIQTKMKQVYAIVEKEVFQERETEAFDAIRQERSAASEELVKKVVEERAKALLENPWSDDNMLTVEEFSTKVTTAGKTYLLREIADKNPDNILMYAILTIAKNEIPETWGSISFWKLVLQTDEIFRRRLALRNKEE